MNCRLERLVLTLSLAGVATIFMGCQTTPSSPPSTSLSLFAGPVREVFEHRCMECHHKENPLAGLDFSDRTDVLRGNASGPFVVAGDPEKSRLWKAIAHPQTHPGVMPGDGWGLKDETKAALRRWIETGAEWPEGRPGQLKRKEYKVDIDEL